ncbi:MAG: sulfotransferase [Hormoscilla sp. GM7CHS1pb]|nr:sulfotransferase [Hormoscilla sp. GM7CHS1pb]
MSEREKNQPFFIVGADRSGTTLLRLMMNEHPRLRVPRESWFLSDLMDEPAIKCTPDFRTAGNSVSDDRETPSMERLGDS